MRAYCKSFKYFILLTSLFVLLPFHASAWWWNDDHECDLVDGQLNIMTINFLFSEIAERDARLKTIAQFAVDNDIHLILLQEVVGGLLAGTNNSAEDLQEFLEIRGLDYNLKTAFETGLPGLLAVANAVLSRCEIRFGLVKRLSWASEIEFNGRDIKLPRNVQMVRLKIPDYGRISVYNTHWCAGCSTNELEVHLQETFGFLNTVERILGGDGRVICGGDLNLDRLRDEGYLYYDILARGFSDVYADKFGGPNQLCIDPDDPDEHCTVDINDLGGQGSRRIDYLFTRNIDAGQGVETQVVFTPFNLTSPDVVSDHAAVVTSVNLAEN